MLSLESFSEKLQIERRKQVPRMTQDKLAEVTGLSVQTISGYETGTKKPTLENAITIANALNVSLDYLCDGSNVEEMQKSAKKIETLADIQTLLDSLLENLNFCRVYSSDDNIRLTIENCPQVARYYDEYEMLSKLLRQGSITENVFRNWQITASNNLKTTSIADHEFPF